MPDDALPYTTLPTAPERIDACGVLMRLVDGLAFRYRWATEDLPPEAPDWRSSADAMTFGEVVVHIHKLARFVHTILDDSHVAESLDTSDLEILRRATLSELAATRAVLASSHDDSLAAVRIARKNDASFWHVINGPLADALTHVGQLNTWRRQFGHPAPRADVFFGRPPAENEG